MRSSAADPFAAPAFCADTRRWQTALHEGGHAVLALEGGMPLAGVDMFPGGHRAGQTSYVGLTPVPAGTAGSVVISREEIVRELTVLMAGAAVVVAARLETWDTVFDIGASADMTMISRHLDHWTTDADERARTLRHARERVIAALETRVTRACVSAVAGLLVFGSATGDDIRELVNAVRQAHGYPALPSPDAALC